MKQLNASDHRNLYEMFGGEGADAGVGVVNMKDTNWKHLPSNRFCNKIYNYDILKIITKLK